MIKYRVTQVPNRAYVPNLTWVSGFGTHGACYNQWFGKSVCVQDKIFFLLKMYVGLTLDRSFIQRGLKLNLFTMYIGVKPVLCVIQPLLFILTSSHPLILSILPILSLTISSDTSSWNTTLLIHTRTVSIRSYLGFILYSSFIGNFL